LQEAFNDVCQKEKVEIDNEIGDQEIFDTYKAPASSHAENFNIFWFDTRDNHASMKNVSTQLELKESGFQKVIECYDDPK